MWKLTIEDDEGKQTHIPLAHEEYGIGRGATNTIRLTDRNISRNHAILRQGGEGWVLKDLQSTNGTFINGVRVVGEQPLGAGEVAQLADYRFELTDERTLTTPPQILPPPHLRPNRLVVVVGPHPGMEYPLDKERFTLGRSEDTDISINHSSVSRGHAELYSLGNGRFEIVDMASANGIRINGVELKRGILEAGDALELGDVRLRFVGAGKIFRADMTVPTMAVGLAVGLPTATGPAQRSGLSTGKILALCAPVLLVPLLGLFWLLRSGGPPPAEGAKKHAVNVENVKQLGEAMKLLDSQDIDGAHKKLLEIREDIRPTEDSDFKAVEAAWANWKFEQVDATPELAKKKTILKEIAQTETVEAKQRTKAAEQIREIDAKEPPLVPVMESAARSSGALAPGMSSKTSDASPPAAPEIHEEAKIRKQLEPKVWGGKGSIDDIKMLKAICGHMGDQACRNRAAALLKQKLEGG